MHLDSAHHAAVDTALFHGVLQRDRVNYRRKHAHMVGSDTVHIDGLLRDAAEEISTADDDTHLASKCMDGCKFFGNFVNEDRVDPEAAACGQGLS